MKRIALSLVCAAVIAAAGSFIANAQTAPPPGPPAGAPGAGAPGGFGGGGGFGGAAGARGGGRGGGRGGFGAPTPTGPAAPVPPEVAIPRPSSEEIVQINDELKRLVETDTSSVKPLMLKSMPLFMVSAPRLNVAATFTQSGVRTAARHDPFVEEAKKGDVDILFEGDSITDWWQQAPAQQGGAEVFKKYFGDSKVANFAIAGDTTQGVLWGLKNGEGHDGDTPVKMQPKSIMLMIGTNNTGSSTGPEIAEGVGAVVLELRKDFPNAKIMLLAIFPRGTGPTDANRVKNEEANKIIAKLDDQKHVFFTNINSKFLTPEGKLIGFRNDNLHPTPEGYDLWGGAVADTLKGWAK